MPHPVIDNVGEDVTNEETSLLPRIRADGAAHSFVNHSVGRSRNGVRNVLTFGNLSRAFMLATTFVGLVYVFRVLQDANQVDQLTDSLIAVREDTDMSPQQKEVNQGSIKPRLVNDQDGIVDVVEGEGETSEGTMVENAWKGGVGRTVAEKDAFEAKRIEAEGLRQSQAPQGDFTLEETISGGRTVGLPADGDGKGEGGEKDNSLDGKLPNVFFILIDDMGYGDIGYQSSDLREVTPNLDRLASEGVKLTNYYSMHLCTPARSALMTGRYPVRYGFQYQAIEPAQTWGLPLSEKIMPQYFNDAGYVSHMVGKWHLGSYDDAYTPYRRGFDSFVGYLNGDEDYWTHQSYTATTNSGKEFFDFGYGDRNGYQDMTLRTDGDQVPEEFSSYIGRYSTDVFTERAEEILMNKSPYDDSPLFMYMSYQAVHEPLGPPPDDAFTPEEREILDRIPTNELIRYRFAEVLMYLDKCIGQFVDLLDTQGWLENSIVVVASDNGACPKTGGTNYPLRGTKNMFFEGAYKVPAFVYSQSHIPLEQRGTEYNKLMSVTDWLPTLASALGWNATEGMAGDLDGVDQWPFDYRPSDDVYMDPRSELLYNWDEYEWDDDQDMLLFRPAKGAFRSGDWKLIYTEWCSGYYSYDNTITDPLVGGDICELQGECFKCGASCESGKIPGDYLFNLKDDPREEINIIDYYPKVAAALKHRANELVDKEWIGALYDGIDYTAYTIWTNHNDWMLPWYQYSLNMTSNSLS